MKLCMDCKHYVPGANTDEDRCRKGEATGPQAARQLVRGEAPEYPRCVTMRGDFTDACRAEARWFEART